MKAEEERRSISMIIIIKSCCVISAARLLLAVSLRGHKSPAGGAFPIPSIEQPSGREERKGWRGIEQAKELLCLPLFSFLSFPFFCLLQDPLFLPKRKKGEESQSGQVAPFILAARGLISLFRLQLLLLFLLSHSSLYELNSRSHFLLLFQGEAMFALRLLGERRRNVAVVAVARPFTRHSIS